MDYETKANVELSIILQHSYSQLLRNKKSSEIENITTTISVRIDKCPEDYNFLEKHLKDIDVSHGYRFWVYFHNGAQTFKGSLVEINQQETMKTFEIKLQFIEIAKTLG